MGTDLTVRKDGGMHRLRPSRLAWLPIPILLTALGVFWAADWQGSRESVYLLLILNLVFSLLVCLVVGYLIARSFLVRSTPGLLLLGCGVVIWGPAGVGATAAARGDANTSITIYNACLWLSALCHLAGVSLSLRSRRPLSPPVVWLLAGYTHAAGAVVSVMLLALAGWMPTFLVAERGGTPVRQVVQEALAHGGAYDLDFRIIRRGGEERYVHCEAQTILDAAGHPTKVDGALQDITERKRTEEQLRRALQEARRRCAEISALMTCTRAVLKCQDLVSATRTVFDACRELRGAPAGYVALLTPEGKDNDVVFLKAGEPCCTGDPALPMPIRGLRGEAYRTGQVVYENDFAHSPWAAWLPPGQARLENVLLAPLVIDGRAIGLLGLGNKPGGFTDQDATLAATFGELAAIALRNSRTLDSLRELNATLEAKVARRTTELEHRTRQLQKLAAELSRRHSGTGRNHRRRLASGTAHAPLRRGRLRQDALGEGVYRPRHPRLRRAGCFRCFRGNCRRTGPKRQLPGGRDPYTPKRGRDASEDSGRRTGSTGPRTRYGRKRRSQKERSPRLC